MNRRVLGRGRALGAVGAALVLVACVLPWYTTSGLGLPPISRNAFDGAGILVFSAALLLVTLIVLPYAAGDQLPGIDRPLAFGLIAGVAVLGLLLRVLQQLDYGDAVGMLPDRGPGLWLAAVGLGIVVVGVSEIATARRHA